MKTRYVIGFALVFSLLLSVPSYTLPQTPPPKSPPVELHLSLSKGVFHPGDTPAVLRVELRNKSWNESFVSTSYFTPMVSDPAYLFIEAKNSKGERYRLGQLQAMGTGLVWWNRIAPNHFYGIEFEFNPWEYDLPQVTDKYELTATYYSSGGSTHANVEWGIPSLNIWKGELNSNTITITLVPKSKRNRKEGKAGH
jgi:hypothetical protein